MELALKKRSRSNQVRSQPLVGVNLRVLPQPMPPPTDGLIPAMYNRPMNEVAKPTMKLTNNPTKLTNPTTPGQLQVLQSKRRDRTIPKNALPLDGELRGPSRRDPIPNTGIQNIHDSLDPSPKIQQSGSGRTTTHKDITSLMNISNITTRFKLSKCDTVRMT